VKERGWYEVIITCSVYRVRGHVDRHPLFHFGRNCVSVLLEVEIEMDAGPIACFVDIANGMMTV
jgi:hypothetical protein